jgi:hypothetical protein
VTDYTPKPRHWIISVLILLALAFAGGSPAAANEKVGICHATGSESNPYVFIEVAEQAALNAHIDRDTGNLHGDRLGNMDFYADDESACAATEPSPPATETPQETPDATPTDIPSAAPTPTAEDSSTLGEIHVVVTDVPDTAMASSQLTAGIALMVLGVIVLSLGFLALVALTRRGR